MNKKITYGLIAGIVYAILTFIVYLFGYEVFASPAKLVPYFIVWGILIYYAFQMRKEQGGFMAYKDAFLSLFVMYLVAELIYTIFLVLLYNVIDPDMAKNLMDITITQMETTLTKIGISGEELDEAIAKIEEQDLSFTFMKAIQSWLIGGVGGLIVSSLVAFIVKKDRPLFE